MPNAEALQKGKVGNKPFGYGLSAREVGESRRKYGENVLQKQKRTPFLLKFFQGFNDPIIRILIGALLINFLFFFQTFDVFETMGIVLAILLSTLISALSERGGEKTFEKLQKSLGGEECCVRRAGVTVKIPAREVVIGDWLLIEAGEKIQADGILVGGSVTVNQSALNGEGEDAEKSVTNTVPTEWDPSDRGQLFRGSLVTGGEGIMRVLRIGQNTLCGRIGADIQRETRESPMKLRLTKLAKQMSIVGYLAAALVALSYLLNVFFLDSGSLAVAVTRLSTPAFALPQLIRALALATTVIVVAVPEGLPMMISVVLASNMKRMKKDQVLVRKSVGIETAGSMNILFTDKTGTLTEGKPSVVSFLTGNGETYTRAAFAKTGELYRHYLLNARYNTMSAVVGGEVRGGNGTDRAILQSVLHETIPNFSVTDKVPFDSARKYSAATVGGVRYIKGAWEQILERTSFYYTETGEKKPLRSKAKMTAMIRDMTRRAMRVIAVATGEGNGAYTLVCVIGIRDELRTSAKEAVTQLKAAGIQVVMMTGDSADTAKAIALDCGICDRADDVILTSAELKGYSDEKLLSVLPCLRVIARALPTDKTRLVQLSAKAGLTTGMTGDGINDAPSLRIADVGFAMGSGTEVAKEAGDIVILDDNISSIAKAVLYGRTIFKSIRKFIVFQLTTNLSAVAVSIICPFCGVDAPVTVLQMLWLNMIMDTFGSLAFAGEAPLPEYMRETPKKRTAPILNRYMILRILTGVAYTVTLCLSFVLSKRLRAIYGYTAHPVTFLCAFFTLFIFADIFNCFGARTTRLNPFSSLGKNRAFMVILSGISVIQIMMIYFGGSVFRTTPLSLVHFLIPFCLALTVVPFQMVQKRMLKKVGHGDTV